MGPDAVRLWDISADRLVARACSYAIRNLTYDEWETYFGHDVDYRRTCNGLPIHPSVVDAEMARRRLLARVGRQGASRLASGQGV